MSAKDYFRGGGPFYKRLEEVKEKDPERIKFKEEFQRHYIEWHRLNGEVGQLVKQKNEAKDEEGRKELEQQVKLKSLEKDLAVAKQGKASYQQLQRSSELEKEMLLKEEKTATSDDMKREIQSRLVEAEGDIREYKEEVNKFQSAAKSLEERLGLLVKEEVEKVRDDALKRGYVLLQLYTSLMVGTSGVGKTLLKYLLLGKDPPLLRCSTACAEKPVRIRSVTLSKFKKRFGKWFDINAEKLLPMIGRYIRKNVEQLKKIIPEEMKGLLEQLEISVVTPPAENVSSATTSEADSTTPVVAEASVSLPSDVEPISQEEEAALKEMIDSVFGKLEKLISGEELSDEEAEELFCSIWVYFTDSGGQPQFHELLPLFIHNISSVIFVSRLSDRLDDRPPDEYYVEGVPLGKRSCTHLTTTEQVQCLTRSLLSRDSNSSKPPVIIMVGTHRDLMSECSETIDEKNAKLIKMFGPELKKHLVFYKPSTKLLFPVNCLHPEIEDEEVARLIQQAVESAVVKRLEVPLWWFVLELLLQGLASKLNKRVLSRRFCVCVANALGFTEKSFDAALSYFNELNIMKYSKALPHLVFVDSQVPLDNVSDLVEEGYLLRHGEGSTRQGDGKQFCDEGIVTVEYLNSTCKHFEKPLFEAPQLLTLLENQLATVPLVLSPVVKHFMPTLLDILSLEDLEKQRVLSFEVAVPLLFRFSHGCRRAGVFCCLIVYLMKECAWKIHSEGGELMLVARNCVTFSLPSCTCIVTLIDAFYFIEAHITQATPCVCVKACPMIRKAVIDGINAACVSLRYENDHPHLAFFCEHPGTTGAASPPSYEARHAAVVKQEDGCCICTEGKHISELQENQTIWLTENEPGVKNSASTQSKGASTSIDYSTLPHLGETPTLSKLSVLRTSRGKKIKIIERMAPLWQTLGDLLDFDESGSKLDLIKAENPCEPEACCRAMFQHWLKGNGVKPHTWWKLTELIADCYSEDFADDIRDALLPTV